MAHQFGARLTAPLHNAWRGKVGSGARRTLGKIGFWIAQPGLDAACQRQLEALQRSRRNAAEAATSAKRLELRMAGLERQADEAGGQGDTAEQLAELRRQYEDLQARQERAFAVSHRLMTEINAFRAGREATRAAYTAAEEVANTVWHG